MRGPRLITGLIVMGLVVPVLLFFLLGLRSLTDLFVISAMCFFSWGVTDLVGSILSRPRLRDRSPSNALRNIDLTTKQARQRDQESSNVASGE